MSFRFLKVFVLISLLSNQAWSIPSPDTFARAKLKALSEHVDRGRRFLFLGDLVAVVLKQNEGTGGNGATTTYIVKSTQQGTLYCVEAVVEASEAPRTGASRSSDEVIARVVSVSPFERCDE